MKDEAARIVVDIAKAQGRERKRGGAFQQLCHRRLACIRALVGVLAVERKRGEGEEIIPCVAAALPYRAKHRANAVFQCRLQGGHLRFEGVINIRKLAVPGPRRGRHRDRAAKRRVCLDDRIVDRLALLLVFPIHHTEIARHGGKDRLGDRLVCRILDAVGGLLHRIAEEAVRPHHRREAVFFADSVDAAHVSGIDGEPVTRAVNFFVTAAGNVEGLVKTDMDRA